MSKVWVHGLRMIYHSPFLNVDRDALRKSVSDLDPKVLKLCKPGAAKNCLTVLGELAGTRVF